MKNKRKPVKTHIPMTPGNFRLKSRDRELLIKAAARVDENLSEFMRNALRERAGRVLGAEEVRAA
jgi:uncharacterized protein (DUF1778 family)